MRDYAGRLQRWSERLTVRVTVAVALIIAGFAGVSAWTNVREVRSILLQRLEAKAEDLGRLVADLAASHVEELRAFELRIILEDLARQQDVLLAEVVGRDGYVVATSAEDESLLRQTDEPAVRAVLASGRRVIEHRADTMIAALPVALNGRLVGAIHLCLDLTGVRAAMDRVTHQHVLVALGLVALALPLAA
jgi:uncharacterized membrane protein affecting hemolysin expression